ncbi:MAG: 23S rRNA (pseudouridine(1915)-N(3))-methyltransferase RlmH [Bacteroidetes bacterium]|nr:23S rRNA (pseudouridine(1915)-N(3))-methyltransferase RlmH [Bacteroidota bacterium]
MTIELWSLGKENNKRMDEAITEYTKRINRYQAFKMVNIDNTKINKNTPHGAIISP